MWFYSLGNIKGLVKIALMSCFKGLGLRGNKEVYQVKHFLLGVARLSSYSLVANYKSSVRRSVHYYCVMSSLERERSIFWGGGGGRQFQPK